jgi:hypothetical protein
MRMNLHSYKMLAASLSLVFLQCITLTPKHSNVQDNPVLIPEAATVPVIDGKGDDTCWQGVPWQPISQVWIPYDTKVDSSDYFGRYKAVWSASTNLLYFLVEVTDNIFVDGFISGKTAEIFNYDIVEVFIDEDNSGGLHVFDGKADIGLELGTNAENAFSYHIYAPFPKEGEVTKEHIEGDVIIEGKSREFKRIKLIKELFAGDIAGTSWSDVRRVNYASHLPEYALRKTGTKAIWEFSLIVYNDKYNDTAKNYDSARVQLCAGKVMGLSLAYCDNDHPEKEPKVRDKFFGSVWVPEAAYNDHWKNADYFGTAKLVLRPKQK